jgi:hypothetical protein
MDGPGATGRTSSFQDGTINIGPDSDAQGLFRATHKVLGNIHAVAVDDQCNPLYDIQTSSAAYFTGTAGRGQTTQLFRADRNHFAHYQ